MTLSFSLKYAPPEIVALYVAKDSRMTADQAADVWAIGNIFFELLTGERVFPSGTPTKVRCC